jgi:hypothetical protein
MATTVERVSFESQGRALVGLLALCAVIAGCAHSSQGTVMTSSRPAAREAIESTVIGVAHHIDHKAWRELRALYAESVQTDYTSLFGGEVQQQPGDALIEAWKKLLTPVVTQHLLGPITVEIDGATATARCHVRGYHHAKGAAGGDEWMVAGHYVFGLTQDGSSWKIRSMKLELLYQTGNLQLLAAAGGG